MYHQDAEHLFSEQRILSSFCLVFSRYLWIILRKCIVRKKLADCGYIGAAARE